MSQTRYDQQFKRNKYSPIPQEESSNRGYNGLQVYPKKRGMPIKAYLKDDDH